MRQEVKWIFSARVIFLLYRCSLLGYGAHTILPYIYNPALILYLIRCPIRTSIALNISL